MSSLLSSPSVWLAAEYEKVRLAEKAVSESTLYYIQLCLGVYHPFHEYCWELIKHDVQSSKNCFDYKTMMGDRH